MDIFEKVFPFLTTFPRWLQLFFFAVLAQTLLLVFLGTTYVFRSNVAKAQTPSLGAFPLESEQASETGKSSTSLSASLVLKDRERFPIANVTVLNSGPTSELLVGFDLVVEEYEPYASIPESRTIAPLALVDVHLPMRTGTYPFGLESPVLVTPGDAVTLAFRFSVKDDEKRIRPRDTADYRLRLVLRSQTGTRVASSSFAL